MATFYMMIGLSGTGKTYYANILGKDGIVLSSDEIRKKLYGDESVQGDSTEIFGIMQKCAIASLNAGKNVVYDATNVVRKRRIATLNQLPKGTKKIAIVVYAPLMKCFERNDARERVVPHEVIMQQLRSFQIPLKTEGFDNMMLVMEGHENEDFYFDICDKMSHDNPYHAYSVGEHIKQMMRAATIDMPDDTMLYSLCKYHDIGKALTKTIDEAGFGHFYGHEGASAYLTLGITGDFRLASLVGEHMKLHHAEFNIDKLKKFFNEEDINYLRRLNYYDKTYA